MYKLETSICTILVGHRAVAQLGRASEPATCVADGDAVDAHQR